MSIIAEPPAGGDNALLHDHTTQDAAEQTALDQIRAIIEASSDPAATARRALALIAQQDGEHTFTVPLITGGTFTERCPKGCTRDHSSDEHGAFLEDIYHLIGREVEMAVNVFDAEQGAVTLPILRASVQVDPYSPNPRFRVPHVNFEPAADDVMEGLDPNEFGVLIGKVRAHLDELDEVHTRLVQARAEWTGRTQ